MILTALFVLIAIAAMTQPTAPRLFAAALFVLVTAAHEIFLSDLDGVAYYGSAALFDLAIIILISGINPVPKMVISLQLICLASILANFIGWLIWFAYAPPHVYNLSFIALYSWALFILIKRSGDDVGGFTADSWRSCFHYHWVARLINHHKDEETL